MSNLVEHAKREFLAIGYKPVEECEDDPSKWIQENIIELLELFSRQGHSGSSAPYCIEMFSRLAKYEPLAPLSGEQSEWMDVSDEGGRDGGMLYQNKRCSHVFMDTNGAYDIDGLIFRHANGACYSNGDSRVAVTFPYTPKTEYIDVPDPEEAS